MENEYKNAMLDCMEDMFSVIQRDEGRVADC